MAKAKGGTKPPSKSKTKPPTEKEMKKVLGGTRGNVVTNPTAELWRQFPLSRWTLYGATASDIKKLAEGKHKKGTTTTPITTVGELSDFCLPFKNDPTRNYQFTDLKGIGAEVATRIGDAEARFWNEWKTKGLEQEFAREKGHGQTADSFDGRKPDANDATQPGTGSGADAGGGKGDKPGKPTSPRRRKPHADNPGSKAAKSPKPKHHKRLPRVGGQSTPKINPSGVDPAAPFADGHDEHPPTVPFDDGRQAAGKEPKSDAGGEEPSAAAGT